MASPGDRSGEARRVRGRRPGAGQGLPRRRRGPRGGGAARAEGVPAYHAGYCGAFVRDPDGNNVEAVCYR